MLYSMPVGVIGSRHAWAGESITIILISERKHIEAGLVCFMYVRFWVLS